MIVVQHTQMLCYSDLINPGETNIPAGTKECGDWEDIWGDDYIDE